MKKTEHEEIKYKLIVIGDENVGKTSIINRFKTNQFTGDYEPTVGLDFQSIPLLIDNQNVTLLLDIHKGKKEISITEGHKASQCSLLVRSYFSFESKKSYSS